MWGGWGGARGGGALCTKTKVIQANFTIQDGGRGVQKRFANAFLVFQETDLEEKEHLGESFCFD